MNNEKSAINTLLFCLDLLAAGFATGNKESEKTVSLTISNTKVKNVQVQKNIAYGKRSVAG